VTSGSLSADTVSKTISISGIQSGDLIILAGASDNEEPLNPSGSGTTSNVTFYSGDIDVTPGGSSNVAAGWHYGIASSTSVTIGVNACDESTTRGYEIIYSYTVWRGVDQTTPILTWAKSASGTEQSTIDPPQVDTTGTNGCMIVTIGALDDDSVENFVVPPTNYTLAIAANVDPEDTDGTGTSGATIMQAYWEQTTGGTENPSSFSFSPMIGSDPQDQWASWTLALKPA